MIIYTLIESIFCLFLVFPFLSVVISLFIPNISSRKPIFKTYDFACVITAYKDATITINLINSLLNQKHSLNHIYLVIDDCEIFEFKPDIERVSVIKPEAILKSKVKSIQLAISSFIRRHDAIIIFDPDNLAHPECLSEINYYLNLGYKAVQGRRTAKNLDNFYACLDAVGEYYYNYTQRQVPFKLGSSATIAGSGMAFISEEYINFLNNEQIRSHQSANKVIVAEDKMLQVDFVGKGNRIAYAQKAIIYDEKVGSGVQVERQRTRWINSYFLHLKDGLGLLWKGLKNLNHNQLYFAYTIIIPPMFLQVGVSLLLLAINIFYSWIHFFVVAISLLLFSLNFILVLYLGKAPSPIWKSLWAVPFFVANQILALLRLKRSNKDFMVTEKQKHLSIDEVIEKQN